MKKGFTLIEMLGVIVILAVIGMITVPIVTNTLNDSKNNLSADQEQLIINAAKAYVGQNPFDSSFEGDGKIVSADYLMEEGFLQETDDLKDKYIVKIKKENNNYKYLIEKIGQ